MNFNNTGQFSDSRQKENSKLSPNYRAVRDFILLNPAVMVMEVDGELLPADSVNYWTKKIGVSLDKLISSPLSTFPDAFVERSRTDLFRGVYRSFSHEQMVASILGYLKQFDVESIDDAQLCMVAEKMAAFPRGYILDNTTVSFDPLETPRDIRYSEGISYKRDTYLQKNGAVCMIPRWAFLSNCCVLGSEHMGASCEISGGDMYCLARTKLSYTHLWELPKQQDDVLMSPVVLDCSDSWPALVLPAKKWGYFAAFRCIAPFKDGKKLLIKKVSYRNGLQVTNTTATQRFKWVCGGAKNPLEQIFMFVYGAMGQQCNICFIRADMSQTMPVGQKPSWQW